MEVMRNPSAIGPCVLVLGMFDGVHRGHQELLMQGGERAKALHVPLVVSTFEPHPMEVLFPQKAPRRLTTLSERAELMAGYGVDALCVEDFTRELADTPPAEFLSGLVRTYAPRCVVCGYNYTFGAKGAGKPEDMQAYGLEHGFETLVVPPVEIAGEAVSSTRIRRELEAGELRMASRLLGHAYTLEGTVEDGKHLGRTIGFPTANVGYDPVKVLPRYGVYIGYLRPEGEKAMASVINIGLHPTLPDGTVTVEAHVLEENENLYGKKAVVTLMDFLRPETRFASKEELTAQIAKDREAALGWFAQHAR